MAGTRLTPLGRLVLLVAALVGFGVVTAAGATATRPRDQDWKCVVVRPGDTLWELARGEGGDIRSAVERVKAENRLTGAAIQPGMGLWVPAAAHVGSDPPSACEAR